MALERRFKCGYSAPVSLLLDQPVIRARVRRISAYSVRPERPLRIGDSEPEPDISVVRGEPNDWLERHPSTAELVVEISVSTIDTDVEKADIYAEAGVPEYWLVRPEQAEVDVYLAPANGRYTEKVTLRGADTLHCGSIAGVEVKLGDLFAVRA